MSDRKIIAGVIIGAAALAAVGYLMTDKGKSKRKKIFDKAHDIVDRLQHSVDKFEGSARRNARHLADRGSEYLERAQEKTERWADKAR